MRRVEHGVLAGHLGGERPARLGGGQPDARGPAPPGAGRGADRAGATDPSGSAIVNPPNTAGAALSGCPSIRAACANTAAGSCQLTEERGAASTAPATAAAEDDPRPRSSGIRLSAVQRERRAAPGRPRRATDAIDAAHQVGAVGGQLVGALALPRDTPGSASVSTVTSLQRSSASPKQSNPGPRFAEVAGTRTVRRTPLQPQLGRDGGRVGRDRRRGCAAPAIAHSGSFRPWPVSMQTTVAPGRKLPLGVQVQEAGDARGARRLREHAPRARSGGRRPGSRGR